MPRIPTKVTDLKTKKKKPPQTVPPVSTCSLTSAGSLSTSSRHCHRGYVLAMLGAVPVVANCCEAFGLFTAFWALDPNSNLVPLLPRSLFRVLVLGRAVVFALALFESPITFVSVTVCVCDHACVPTIDIYTITSQLVSFYFIFFLAISVTFEDLERTGVLVVLLWRYLYEIGTKLCPGGLGETLRQ